MSAPSSRSDAEEHLLALLQSVNEWLRFAETKNAGLVALASVTAGAFLGFQTAIERFEWPYVTAFVVSGILLLGSLIQAVRAFLPRQNASQIPDNVFGKRTDQDNLYFYAHLARHTPESLLTAVGSAPVEPGGTPQHPRYRFERDLAHQVVTNSMITKLKMDNFNWAAYAWAFGTLAGVAGVVIALIMGATHAAE